jgi:hypothetical protein
MALATIDTIRLHLNSGGGSVFDGIAFSRLCVPIRQA